MFNNLDLNDKQFNDTCIKRVFNFNFLEKEEKSEKEQEAVKGKQEKPRGLS